MALKNPTVFYWGQNRLLNVLPFALQFVPWPALNLYLTLFSATAAFFALLWLIATAASFLGKPKRANTALVFLLLVWLCILVFKYKGWVDICLWHFEYSLAFAAALLNALFFYSGRPRLMWPGCLAGFLALGVNPALIIWLCCFLFFRCLYLWKIGRQDAYLAILWLGSFFIWLYLGATLVQPQYGTVGDYTTFLPLRLPDAAEESAVNWLREYIRIAAVSCSAALGLSFAILILLSNRARTLWRRSVDAEKLRMTLYVTFSTLLACIVCGSLIVCMSWSIANQSAPRYLIPIFFACLFIVALWLSLFLSAVRQKHYFLLGCFLYISGLFFFYSGHFDVTAAAVYKACDRKIPAGERVYAGDYWQAWSCVSRDLNAGFNSHAIAYRSSSDRAAIEAKLRAKAASGNLDIICLGADNRECEKQLGDFFENYRIGPIKRKGEGMAILSIEKLQ